MPRNLPQFQGGDPAFQLMQNAWASALQPIMQSPANYSLVLKGIALINGTTTINHLLGRKLQGWKVVRQRAAASIYDTQDSNQMPDKTLTLVSNAAVTVDLEVF